MEEFRIYPALFDPQDYTRLHRRHTLPSVEEALARIDMYKSPFGGWSMYSVDGVFFDKQGKMYEEATQVVRIMFRFKSAFEEVARAADCLDVLRCLIFWAIRRHTLINERKLWSKPEEKLFLASQAPWPAKKQAFVEQYYRPVLQELHQWFDDRALFVFGYLVRQFAENVLAEELYEEEIWVTSIFEQHLNVIRRAANNPSFLS